LEEEIGNLLGLPHSPDAVYSCMMWSLQFNVLLLTFFII
jgi:hypothetical protein